MRLTWLVPVALLFVALCACATFGQAQRTFVSGSGSDSNPCSRTAPCRTFDQAISQTNAGGEVTVLDSAGYGAFTINKSISVISPPGVYAGISVFSGTGITVNAGSTDIVTVRGLSLNNQGGGGGVSCNAVGTLRVESCVVRGFTQSTGIDFAGGSSVVVKDTVISDCYTGLSVTAQMGASLHATLEHLTVARSINVAIDVFSSGSTQATIRDSDLSGNHIGVEVEASGARAAARLDVERCLITGGATGVIAGFSSASVSISNCVITRNTNGFATISGGTMYTRGNNTIFGNNSSQGSLTPLPAQ
jgi:hypothetical protein